MKLSLSYLLSLRKGFHFQLRGENNRITTVLLVSGTSGVLVLSQMIPSTLDPLVTSDNVRNQMKQHRRNSNTSQDFKTQNHRSSSGIARKDLIFQIPYFINKKFDAKKCY